MIEVDNERVKGHTTKYINEIAKGSKAALMFDDFMSNTLDSMYANTPFPEKVNLSFPVEEMMRGNFGVADTIIMPPPTIAGHPIWRGSTLDGFVLRGAGYVNGDSRSPCFIALDDNIPHGLLAGATGHGKSVTLNSIIVMGALEYAPWEVQYVMVDAKIVEFKSYGVNPPLPHISSIAATEDAEYIISVLEDARDLMMKRNSVFTVAGVKNIKSFRKKDMREAMGIPINDSTEPIYLAMPHIVIPMDEFQTMFKNAARKGPMINKLIDLVARLGRNTGVHLLLASQELGSDLDKGMLGNLGTRLCLGCLPKTSEQILGNDEAKTNFGQKGRLIINNNPAVGSVDDNVSLRTPFLPDIKIGDNMTIYQYMTELNQLGKVARPDRPLYDLSFYDEQRFDYEADFLQYVKERATPLSLYLGEPSFVLHNDDGEKWLRLEMSNESNENILIFSPLKKNRQKYLKMLFYNFVGMSKRYPKVVHKVLYADRQLFESIGFDKLPNCTAQLAREYLSPQYSVVRVAVWRKILIECDERAFGSITPSEANLTIFNDLLNADGKMTGELWPKRAHVMLELLKSQSYISAFGLKAFSGKQLEAQVNGIVKACLGQFTALDHEYEKITISAFEEQFVWIVGMDSTIGLGVDYKTSYVDELKGLMREASEYKVHFIISTSTMEDTATMRTALTHTLCSDLNGTQRGNLKAGDDYPDTCADILGIYFNSSWEKDKCRKFKKMKFEGEM